jgi:aminopeptidase YwaD
MLRTLLGATLAATTLVGCSPEVGPEPAVGPATPSASALASPSEGPTGTSGSPAPPATTTPTAGASSGPGSPTPRATPAPGPATFDRDRALAHVRVLAGRIGPRLATGPAFREAAAYVQRQLVRAGYQVSRQRFGVPAGDSWGVPVAAGTSANVVGRPPGFDPTSPYLVVGAHLDTVAVAPGAEDNASGVSVLLEVARLAQRKGTRLPTVLVAFGAEEPRGPGDALHHFGSRAYVDRMSAAERLRGMVSLDRVGVGGRVPVCTGPLSPPRVRDELLAVARRRGIPTGSCGVNTSSDHWSFEKAGHAVARLGSTPYAGYHSAGDVPSVVGGDQLGRVGRLIWGWLRSG